MCELLGISFNEQISPYFSFQGLLEGADSNPHGWGLGFYPEESATALVIKEPIRGDKSCVASFLAGYKGFRSKTFVAHVRRSSYGANTHDNTHPFNRFFCRREFLFAHNGTLYQPPDGDSLKFKPIGETDSERAFCCLLSWMSRERTYPRRNGGLYQGFSIEQNASIHRILKQINLDCNGSFNCIFTDGFQLFCYRDIRGARDLFWLKRQVPFARTIMRDRELEIELNLEKGTGERGVIVASTPLSKEERWQSFHPGQLLAIQEGEIIYNHN